MKSIKFLLVIALSAFALGCGGDVVPKSTAEQEKAKTSMEADMQKMSGSVPKMPNANTTGTPATPSGTTAP